MFLFLQEVHYSKDKEVIWSAEWGYTAIFSSLLNAIVGVSILFNNVFEFQLLKANSDPNGRFVISDIKTDSMTLTLVNICLPNNDEPSFVESVLKMFLSLSGRNACGVAILTLLRMDKKIVKVGGQLQTKNLEKKIRVIGSSSYRELRTNDLKEGKTMICALLFTQCTF